MRWPVEPWPCCLFLYAIWRSLYSITKRNHHGMILPVFSGIFGLDVPRHIINAVSMLTIG